MNTRRPLFRTLFLAATLVGALPLSANDPAAANSPTEINNALIDALKNKDQKKALALIAQDESLITKKDADGLSPLHLAIDKHMLPVISALAAQKTTLEVQDDHLGMAPLCYAVRMTGSLPIIEILLSNGADLHRESRGGFSPLSCAAQTGHTKVVKRFLQEDVLPSELGRALSEAAQYCHWEIVQLLLDAGANPGKEGRGALSHTASHGNLAIVNTLLQAGANPNECDGQPLQNASCNGHTEIARILLAWNADPNSRNYYWKTPLHFAAENGHAEIVSELLCAGADVNVFEWGFLGRYRETPLHKAANEGHIECARLLLAAGADINAKDIGIFEETALAKAQKYHRTSMANFLLEHGAHR